MRDFQVWLLLAGTTGFRWNDFRFLTFLCIFHGFPLQAIDPGASIVVVKPTMAPARAKVLVGASLSLRSNDSNSKLTKQYTEV